MARRCPQGDPPQTSSTDLRAATRAAPAWPGRLVDAWRSSGRAARPWRQRAVAQIRGHVGWRALKRARADGSVRQTGRTYHLPDDQAAAQQARTSGGVRSHTTAAAQHRLALPPGAVRHHPRDGAAAEARPRVRKGVELHYRDLPAPRARRRRRDLAVQTVVDCLRDEPLRMALSVGDSALRGGQVTHASLRRARRQHCAARAPRGSGSGSRCSTGGRPTRSSPAPGRSCSRRASPASSRRCRSGTGARSIGRVDLAHRALRIVIECDGFEHHGERDRWTQRPAAAHLAGRQPAGGRCASPGSRSCSSRTGSWSASRTITARSAATLAAARRLCRAPSPPEATSHHPLVREPCRPLPAVPLSAQRVGAGVAAVAAPCAGERHRTGGRRVGCEPGGRGPAAVGRSAGQVAGGVPSSSSRPCSIA